MYSVLFVIMLPRHGECVEDKPRLTYQYHVVLTGSLLLALHVPENGRFFQ